MKATRKGLEARTANINQYLIDAGIHPNPESYELQLDYNKYYGGYRMIFVEKESPFGESSFSFSHRRMSASEMELYQGGIFDTLWSLDIAKTNKESEV